MLFSQDIGIDLGTSNTLICVRNKGILIREPSVVAVQVGSAEKRVVAVGNEAKEMIGRTPGSIVAVRPIKDGVIADFGSTVAMLRQFIKKAMASSPLARARVMISIPSGVTEVERKAVHDAAIAAGARYVSLIEVPMAAAIGAGVSVTQPKGAMVVDIGGGTTQVAVLSLGDVVCSRSIRVAGDVFDDAIVQYIRRTYNVLIGERTAEELKISIGSASRYEGEGAMDVRGRGLIDGLPKNIEVTSEDVRVALTDPLNQIVETVRTTLEKTPPELAADIMDTGILLTGGGALLRGMDKLLTEKTGMPAKIAEEPMDCVVTGTAICLDRDTLNIRKRAGK